MTSHSESLLPPAGNTALLLRLLGWTLLGVGLYLIYGHALLTLGQRWLQEEQYNFAIMLPLLAGYYLYTIRDRLQPTPTPPAGAITLLLLTAVLLGIAGLASSIFYLQHLSFLALLTALALYRFGRERFRLVLPALLFLLLSIPLPYVLESALTWRLQGVSARLGTWLIAAFDIPVFLDGNILELSRHRLQVAEACSGLNYLYPLIGLGVVIATFARHKSLTVRLVIVLSAIPIAIVMNGLRIGVAGILVERFGKEVEQGFQHFFQGWVVFLISLGLMALLIRVLPDTSPPPRHDDISPAPRNGSKTGSRWPLVLAAFVSLAILFAFQLFRDRSSQPPERESFATFPVQLGEFRVVTSQLVPDLQAGVGATDTLVARLVDAQRDPLNLFIAYYDHQESGQSPHSPKVCMPGGGWEIMDTRRIRLRIDGRDRPVNRVRIVKGNTTLLVYYWYYGRGKWLANEWRMKWELFRDAITGRHTNNALVRLSTVVKPSDPAAADRLLQRATRTLAPQLPLYLD